MKTEYFSDKVHKALFASGDVETIDKRKNVFARAYLARQKDWSDPVWVGIYKDWLTSGGDDIGLKALRTLAVYDYAPPKGSRELQGYSIK